MRNLKNISYTPNEIFNTGVIYHGNEGPNSAQMTGRVVKKANIKVGYTEPLNPRPRCVPPMKCLDSQPQHSLQTGGYKSPKDVKFVAVTSAPQSTKKTKLTNQVVTNTTTSTTDKKTKVQVVTDKIKGITPKSMKKHVTPCNVKRAGIALAIVIAFGVGRMSKSSKK